MFITVNQVKASLKEGALPYLLLSYLKLVNDKKKKISQLLVVSDFPKVFPNDFPDRHQYEWLSLLLIKCLEQGLFQ